MTNGSQLGYTLPKASDVGSTNIEQSRIIAANVELGRIIALVPTPKTQSTFRLADPIVAELQHLADKLGKSRPDVVELAITHLAGTIRNGQPVYIDPPPKAPASHKRARRVA